MLPSLLRCYSLVFFVGSYCSRSVLACISVPVPVPAPDSVAVSVSAPHSDPAPDPVCSFPSLEPAYSLGGKCVYIIVDLRHGQETFGRLNHKEDILSQSPEGRRSKETKHRSKKEGSGP